MLSSLTRTTVTLACPRVGGIQSHQYRPNNNNNNHHNNNRRQYTSSSSYETSQDSSFKTIAAFAIATTVAVAVLSSDSSSADTKLDYAAIRKDIEDILENSKYDDGSYGPVLVRLAWHASGTYCKNSKNGGSDGATMRFAPESAHGANAGLANARDLLEPLKKKYPGLSYADLWTLAGVVAIEAMGGPKVLWRPGRTDKPDGTYCPPDGRLPDASKGPSHVREIFSRMGFSDKEMVALIGAHAVGRCHTDRSGYTGPWTNSPIVFSNDYFIQLLNNKWTKKKWSGPEQYEDPTGQLMMLPADLALIEDGEFKKYVQMYASDQDTFFKDFAQAFQKLEELGVNFPAQKPWWKFW